LKTSCIAHPAKTPLFVIREDYLHICNGDACAAALLNQMEYWHNIKSEHKSQVDYYNNLPTTQSRGAAYPSELWVYKSQSEWRKELLDVFGEKKIAASLGFLISHGLLSERNNPRDAYDRKKQYLFHVEKVQEAINRYAERIQPKDDVDSAEVQNGCSSSAESILPKCGMDAPQRENGFRHQGESILPKGGVINRDYNTETTAETTSESTTETTSESTAGKSFEEPPNAETKIVAFAPEKKIQVPPSGKIPQAQLSAEFKVFWEAYPSSRRGDKRKTKIEWDKAREGAEFNTIMQGLAKSKQSSQWQEEKFIVHAERFLRGSRWESAETYIPEKSDTSAPGKASRDNSLAENAAYFAQRLLDRQNVRKEAFSPSALIAQ